MWLIKSRDTADELTDWLTYATGQSVDDLNRFVRHK